MKKIQEDKFQQRIHNPSSPLQNSITAPRQTQANTLGSAGSSSPTLTTSYTGQSFPPAEQPGRELSNIRVVQKNLVYLVGLSPR